MDVAPLADLVTKQRKTHMKIESHETQTILTGKRTQTDSVKTKSREFCCFIFVPHTQSKQQRQRRQRKGPLSVFALL